MGRKSNAKKAVREMLKEVESEKSLKKAKKQEKKQEKLKAKAKEKDQNSTEITTKKTRFKININKKKLFGGALVIIMLAILVSVGFLIFEKAFRAEPIAKYLPAESTVAVLEINTNFDHDQLIKSFNLLKNHPEYSKENLLALAEKFFTINYENDIKPWLGREAGIAFVNSAKTKGSIYKLYFAEVLSQTNVEKFMQKYSPVESVYTGQNIFSVKLPGGDTYLTFLDNYLFASPDEQAVFQLIDSQNPSIQKLYSFAKYSKIDNNLPLNRTAFLFLNFDQLNNGFFQALPFLSQTGLSVEMLSPFIKAFDAEGAALVAMDNDFALQSFLGLKTNITGNSDYLSFEKKYSARLANYMSKDTLAFWGGENLENELKKVIASFGGDASQGIFDQILQSYVQKYFGKDVSLKEDILPLFKNEFAFAVEKIKNKNSYKLLFELDSPQADTVKIQQLANDFASIGAVFEPRIVEHTLKDGTVGKEIVATPEEIIKNESIYDNSTIYELRMGTQTWGVYYAVIDNVAIVSTNPDSVKDTIDLMKKNKDGQSSTDIFSSNIATVLKGSDDVSYFNLEAILPLIYKQKPVPAALDLLSSLSSGKNYFNDGIVTINYLHIK